MLLAFVALTFLALASWAIASLGLAWHATTRAESLRAELVSAEEQLAERTQQRDAAREDALFNRWADFIKGAQLEICDKGNRKKLGNCRETVDAAINVDDRRDKFAHCIRSGQAQPAITELEKGVGLPDFAEMIDEDKKQTKGWMILFCDPTLPENTDAPLAEGRLPATE